MVDSNQELLLRTSGHDVHWWAERARAAGLKNDAELRNWMREEHGITGYARYAVSWEMFGYPEFMLPGADELIDGQYAKHPELRPIADALLAWAAATDGVGIQLRKGYVSLRSPKRKFAQVTRANNTTVDVLLRASLEPGGRVEAVNHHGAHRSGKRGRQSAAGSRCRLCDVPSRLQDPGQARSSPVPRISGACRRPVQKQLGRNAAWSAQEAVQPGSYASAPSSSSSSSNSTAAMISLVSGWSMKASSSSSTMR